MALPRPPPGQPSSTTARPRRALAGGGRSAGQTGALVHNHNSRPQTGGFARENPAGRTRRVLVPALDISLTQNVRSTTVARRSARHRLGGECDSSLVLDAGGRREKRPDETNCRTSLFCLAQSGGQRGVAPRASAFAWRRQHTSIPDGRPAAGSVANRPRFLRTLQRALRELPVPRVGETVQQVTA